MAAGTCLIWGPEHLFRTERIRGLQSLNEIGKKDIIFFRMALFISLHFLFADSSFSSDSPNPPGSVHKKNWNRHWMLIHGSYHLYQTTFKSLILSSSEFSYSASCFPVHIQTLRKLRKKFYSKITIRYIGSTWWLPCVNRFKSLK